MVRRYEAAIVSLESRGEKPSARAVLRELGYKPRIQDDGYGTVIDNGMGGKELRDYAEAMTRRGYERVTPIADRPWYVRWRKADA